MQSQRGAVTAVGDDKRLIMPTAVFKKQKDSLFLPRAAPGEAPERARWAAPGTLAGAARPPGANSWPRGCIWPMMIWACVMGAPPAPWTWDCGTWGHPGPGPEPCTTLV